MANCFHTPKYFYYFTEKKLFLFKPEVHIGAKDTHMYTIQKHATYVVNNYYNNQ